MRRIRRRDSLRGKMTSDVQIGRILPLLDCLMMCARSLKRLLLGAAVFIQVAIARFKFVPDARDILFHGGKFRFALR